jgi:hypothetical protein
MGCPCQGTYGLAVALRLALTATVVAGGGVGLGVAGELLHRGAPKGLPGFFFLHICRQGFHLKGEDYIFVIGVSGGCLRAVVAWLSGPGPPTR